MLHRNRQGHNAHAINTHPVAHGDLLRGHMEAYLYVTSVHIDAQRI